MKASSFRGAARAELCIAPTTLHNSLVRAGKKSGCWETKLFLVLAFLLLHCGASAHGPLRGEGLKKASGRTKPRRNAGENVVPVCSFDNSVELRRICLKLYYESSSNELHQVLRGNYRGPGFIRGLDQSGKDAALEVAVMEGNTDRVIALRDQGARKLSGEKWTVAFNEATSQSVREAMILAGVNTSHAGGCGWTPLGYAVSVGCISCVRRLLSEGADIEAPVASWSSQTPLITAAANDHATVVSELLKRSANTTGRDSSTGEIALHMAAAKGYVDVARLLIAQDPVSLNARDYEGKTPLHRATENDHPKMVYLLLQRGADATRPMRDIMGRRALDLAWSSRVRKMLSQ